MIGGLILGGLLGCCICGDGRGCGCDRRCDRRDGCCGW